jgi:hypothetical protein
MPTRSIPPGLSSFDHDIPSVSELGYHKVPRPNSDCPKLTHSWTILKRSSIGTKTVLCALLFFVCPPQMETGLL